MIQPDSIPQRFAWIDWMKSIGIYFIVLGHFFSIWSHYVYVFNVPLFFIISGFLCHREEHQNVFWKKLWYNLIIPMLIICLLNFLYESLLAGYYGTFDIKNVVVFLFNVIIGMHGGKMGVGTCWFIYTLILMKIIYQYIHRNVVHIILAVMFLVGAYIYNTIDLSDNLPYLNSSNSIINLCVSYPFFVLGFLLRTYKDFINSYSNKRNLSILVVLGILLVFVSGRFNGSVWMYICGFGGNFLWFLLGGFAGTLAVFSISKLLPFFPRYISTISKGTILILGFHTIFIKYIKDAICSGQSFWDYMYTALIIAVFVPIIIIAEKYFPLIMGKYRILKVNHTHNI